MDRPTKYHPKRRKNAIQLKNKEINIVVIQSKPVPDRFIGQDAMVHVKPISQAFIKSQGMFQATVFTNFKKIGRKYIADGNRGCSGLSGWDVGHSVMDNPKFIDSGFVVTRYF